MTKLWLNCAVSWVISNNVNTLVVVDYTYCKCKIEAVSIIWTELEHMGIYLRNNVRDVLTNVGLAQAGPIIFELNLNAYQYYKCTEQCVA